ncbi:MAG: enolase C-terminal domain-like protein [Xanthobacteraceae bacterium]
MAGVRLTIESISARPVLAPLPRPIRTAIGTIPSAPLVLIDVVTNQGIVGRSYIFAYTPPALAPLVRFIEEITPELKGKPVVPVERMNEFDRRFRLIGWQGLIGMAVSGLDMAFWDANARMLDQPVVRLLGGAPMPLQAYDSYGLIDPAEDEKAIFRSVEQGFRGIKIKVGEGDLNRDLATVGAVRAMIGPDIALMVDYNQSLNPVEASRRIARLAEHDLHWVEEPVGADDIHGHAQVRAASAVPVQTGENWWFPRDMANAIAAGACDLAMLDLMKIGGVSGWMRAMGQADAASLPVSSHIFIEASAHVLAVTPTAHWLEHLDLAGAILAEPYQAVDGKVTARGPGLGLEWDERAIERFSAKGRM